MSFLNNNNKRKAGDVLNSQKMQKTTAAGAPIKVTLTPRPVVKPTATTSTLNKKPVTSSPVKTFTTPMKHTTAAAGARPGSPVMQKGTSPVMHRHGSPSAATTRPVFGPVNKLTATAAQRTSSPTATSRPVFGPVNKPTATAQSTFNKPASSVRPTAASAQPALNKSTFSVDSFGSFSPRAAVAKAPAASTFKATTTKPAAPLHRPAPYGHTSTGPQSRSVSPFKDIQMPRTTNTLNKTTAAASPMKTSFNTTTAAVKKTTSPLTTPRTTSPVMQKLPVKKMVSPSAPAARPVFGPMNKPTAAAAQRTSSPTTTSRPVFGPVNKPTATAAAAQSTFNKPASSVRPIAPSATRPVSSPMRVASPPARPASAGAVHHHHQFYRK